MHACTLNKYVQHECRWLSRPYKLLYPFPLGKLVRMRIYRLCGAVGEGEGFEHHVVPATLEMHSLWLRVRVRVRRTAETVRQLRDYKFRSETFAEVLQCNKHTNTQSRRLLVCVYVCTKFIGLARRRVGTWHGKPHVRRAHNKVRMGCRVGVGQEACATQHYVPFTLAAIIIHIWVRQPFASRANTMS